MSEQYDYLIVGAGLFGAVFAHQATAKGKRCLVIDKRSHVAGNLHCEEVEGIRVHRYGAHIFHTFSEEVWAFMRNFSEFNGFINSPIAVWGDEVYNLPFNMNTFSRMWGIKTPEQAKEIIRRQQEENTGEVQNLAQQARVLVGSDVYEKLVKGYTEKQWGRPCEELPPFIIRRLPLRFTYDNRYFSDPYQGIPLGGYDQIVRQLLAGSELRLNTEYRQLIGKRAICAKKTVFTGMIDEFFDFSLGHLKYRTLRFESEVLDCDNFQGNAVVNYTGREVPYTRIIEHKHFEFGTQPKTVISREYPLEWTPGAEPYYPVNTPENQALYERYAALAASRPDVLFGGRLGSYRYYDMDKTVEAALSAAREELE